MGRHIWIFGNPDKTEFGFQSPGDLNLYLSGKIFSKEKGRYRYTLARNADVIVLSRDGKAHGHIEIVERVKPNETDRLAYPNVTWVYLVHTSALYDEPVPLGDIGKGIHYGREITEEQFEQIKKSAGSLQEFQGYRIPEVFSVQERVLREIQLRLGQSDFRQMLLKAYGGRCAVTECDTEDVLQAAHILPYCDSQQNHVSNGLLLRADIHLLFDRYVLGIEPEKRTISLTPRLLKSSYADLDGKPLDSPKRPALQPNPDFLKARWQHFLQATQEKHN